MAPSGPSPGPLAARLLLPVAVESVAPACQAVLARCGEGLTPSSRTGVEVVVEEVIMNLVLHAFPDPAAHRFELQVEVDPASLTLRFIDDGRPFDPTTRIPRDLPSTLSDAQPGGLGLRLLRRRTRSMQYARRDGRNELTLVLDLQRA
jgi:anti-sigma regulatory factor (Ser/Thr protein kinase)